MNSSFPILITLGGICFLLTGWTRNSSSILTSTQMVNDSTVVVQVPVNTDRSIILWKGTEMWETGKHEGTVSLDGGYLSYKNGQIVGGNFVADMNSIAITDIPEHEPVPRRNLRNHLKSEDFFYVEKYPTAEFGITKTEPLKDNRIKVWGDLSIRDVTKPIIFTATHNMDRNSTVVLKADFTIDRFTWNVSYQGSYWDRITSILDNTFVDADISLSVEIITSSMERKVFTGKR